jgi:hypothetical protein
MKRIVVLFIEIQICSLLFSQQILFNVGDNVLDYLSKNPTNYLVPGQKLFDIPEGRIDFRKYKNITVDEDTKFLTHGLSLLGVMQNDKGVTIFLYDLNGDGILDNIHDNLIIPPWVLSKSPYTQKTNNNNLKDYLDKGLSMFNGDDNPYATGLVNNYLAQFFQNIGPSYENRDLFYAFFLYYYLAAHPDIAYNIICQIEIDYKERFDSVHPIIILHKAETLINMQEYQLANELIKNLLEIEPDFIPAKVYSWQLEIIPAIRQYKYNNLKSNYPSHWIVKLI